MWDRRLQVCQMPTIGQNACVQTFAKVVDSFVDRYLWQVITDIYAVFIMSTNMLDIT